MPHHHTEHIISRLGIRLDLPPAIKHIYEFSLINYILSLTIGIYIPLYIYTQTGSLSQVLLYIIFAYGVFEIPILFAALGLLERIGIEGLMYLSSLAYVLEGLLLQLPLNRTTTILLAILNAVTAVFYWTGYHTAFGLFGRKREEAEEVAGLTLLLSIASVLMPLLMGLFVMALGYKGAFLLMLMAGVILSTYLIRHTGKIYRVRIDISSVVGAPFKATWMFSGIYYMVPLLVALYSYYLGKSVMSFGLLFSVVGLSASIFSLFVASRVDRYGSYGLALVEPLVAGILFFIYPHIGSVIIIYLLEVLRQLAATGSVALYGAIYRLAKEDPGILLGRNLYIYIGRIVGGSIMLLRPDFGFVFLTGSLFTLLFMLSLIPLIRAVGEK